MRSLRVRALGLLSIGLLSLGAVACGPSRTASEAKADLSSADAEVRLKASRSIEDEAKSTGKLPTDVVDALLAQAEKEGDKKVKGSLVIALGYTGDARAKTIIEAYLQTDDPDQQRWAGRAWSWYLIRTGKFEEGHKFPAKFPYGTEGFPAPASK